MEKHNFLFWKEGKKEHEHEKKAFERGQERMTVEDEEPQSWSRGKESMKSNWSEKSGWWKDDILCVTYFLYAVKILFGKRKYEWNTNEIWMKVAWKWIGREFSRECNGMKKWIANERRAYFVGNEWVKNSMVWSRWC